MQSPWQPKIVMRCKKMGICKASVVILQRKHYQCPSPHSWFAKVITKYRQISNLYCTYILTSWLHVSLFSTLNCTFTVKLNETMNVCAMMVTFKSVQIRPMGKMSLWLHSFSHEFWWRALCRLFIQWNVARPYLIHF